MKKERIEYIPKGSTVKKLGRPSSILLEGDDFTKKTTYYIKNSNLELLKRLAIERSDDLSFLVNEAIELFLKQQVEN